MPGHSAHGHKGSHSAGHGDQAKSHPRTTSDTTHRRVVAMQKPRGPIDKDLEGLLSSAMLATDKQLNNVVHEVDRVSRALKSGASQSSALRTTVHPAVWHAVRHIILERELRHLALTDELTCFYNKRAFVVAATQQIKMARRYEVCVSLFFCHLDNLRDINDAFGQREGERALVRTADALEKVFRDSDILARLGRDEFAALAYDAPAKDEETILQRLEESLLAANAEDKRYRLSLSIGTSRLAPGSGVNLADLMAQADRAMEEKKRSKHDLFSCKA
jgi:diguanylate cyclase (GGDEF)-like protein